MKNRSLIWSSAAGLVLATFLGTIASFALISWGQDTPPAAPPESAEELVQAWPEGRVITEPGVYEGFTSFGTVVVAADNVTLRDFTIDCGWKTQHPYGVRVDTREDGTPYRYTNLVDGDISRAWKKGVVCHWTRIRRLSIHDCGSDGVFVGVSGVISIQGLRVWNMGRDEGATAAQKSRLEDREGRPLHADGIQLTGGTAFKIRNADLVMRQGYGDGRAGNACIFVKGDFGNITDLDIVGGTMKGANHCVRIMDGNRGFHVRRATIARTKIVDPWSIGFLDQTAEGVRTIDLDLTHAKRRKP